MFVNSIEMAVLIRGRPVTEYLQPVEPSDNLGAATIHEKTTYIEGRDGSEYSLLFRNNTMQRVCVVISVDGLSIMDGKAASRHSAGYLLDGRDSMTIPGWRVDGRTIASFVFGSAHASYVNQISGETAHAGVIGAIVFAEQCSQMPAQLWPLVVGSSYGAESVDYNALPQNSASHDRLGTAFGPAKDFRTRTEEFARGHQLARLIMYYETAAGLRKRGIIVSPKTLPEPPNPFQPNRSVVRCRPGGPANKQRRSTCRSMVSGNRVGCWTSCWMPGID